MKTRSSILLCATLSLATIFLTQKNYAQPLSVSLSGPTCTASTLTLLSNITPYKIVWKNSGTVYQTTTQSIDFTATTSAATGMSSLNAITLDRSNNILAALNDGTVVQYPAGSSSGTTPTTIAQKGLSTFTYAVKVDTAGYIYVVDNGNQNIVKFPPTSTATTTGTIVAHSGVNNPFDVFIDKAGYIYVANYDGPNITKYPAGSTSSTVPTIVAKAGLLDPTAVFVDTAGYIYVSDGNNNKIVKFPPTSTATTTGTTIGANGLNYPQGLQVDGLGNVYVADAGNNRVVKFNAGSDASTIPTVIAGDGTSGPGATQLPQPTQPVFDINGNMFVSDPINVRVQEFSNNISLTAPATSAGNYSATVTTLSGDATTTSLFNVKVDSNRWIGGISTDWNTVGNWNCGFTPTATSPAIITTGMVSAPVINSGNFFTSRLSITTSASLTLNTGATLNISGDLADSGVIKGAGTIILDGSSLQHIIGTGRISNLTLNNNAGATIATGSNMLSISKLLTITLGTLTTNGSLTILSDSTGTGRIGQIISGSVSGTVNIQQYIPGGRRAYRFLGHPFSTSIPLSQIQTYIDITGSGGAANGFTTTGTNAPSSFWYNTAVANSSLPSDPGFIAFTNTNGLGNNAFKQYQGIDLFIRGAKGQGLDALPYTPLPVTITMSGPINQGPLTVVMKVGTPATYRHLNMLSNPYPAPADIGTVIANAKAANHIIGSAFYVWNPYLSTGGAFETITIGGPYYIQACSSFQVYDSVDGNPLLFAESNKGATSNDTLLFRASTVARSNANYLSLDIYDSDYHKWDNVRIKFDKKAKDATEDNDAEKLSNIDLDFYSLSPSGQRMSIDARPYAKSKMIPLGITTSHQQTFIIKADNVAVPAGGSVYLHDKYLKKYIAIKKGAEYKFTVDADIKSQGDERFELTLGAMQVAKNKKTK